MTKTLNNIIDEIAKDINSGKIKAEVLDCMGGCCKQQYVLEFDNILYCMHPEFYCPMQEYDGRTDNPECNLEYYEGLVKVYNCREKVRRIGFEGGYRLRDEGYGKDTA